MGYWRPSIKLRLLRPREITEASTQERKQLLHIKISGDRNHRFTRMVMGLHKVKELFTPHSSDHRGVTENRASERVPVQRLLHVPILCKIFGVILHHAYFFENDLLFFF